MMKKFKIYQKIPISLSKKIIILNLIALIILLSGILYLNQFRQGLIETKINSFTTQGEIIASTISASATSSNKTNLFFFDKNINQGPGFTQRVIQYRNYVINKKLTEKILGELIDFENIRAQIYDNKNELIHDTNESFFNERIGKYKLESIEQKNIYNKLYSNITDKLGFNNLNNFKYSNNIELLSDSLRGHNKTVVTRNERKEAVVSVSIPIVKFKAIIGYLVLSNRDNSIDIIVNQERQSIFKVFMVASIITIVLSLILSYTIGKPMRALADAADDVTKNMNKRKIIPDFSYRKDEIGDLSRSLSRMTISLYNRIDNIEKFSADVAHELRNPLTSLRSAIEAFPIIKKESERVKLIKIIQNDIDRIDRLISDISETSKLDAALVFEEKNIMDICEVLDNLITLENIRKQSHPINLKINHEGHKLYALINVHRITQVFSNLFDNARSFSKRGSEILVEIIDNENDILISLSDEGSGISGSDINRIFERFYTDRSEELNNKKHSGLGLSIVKQIIETHNGSITVVNNSINNKAGATFMITLPKYR
tara:strand:- start:12135 stop:13769 length:1635 start_codon:yes stop_codon:yes gene_type:complete